MTIRFLLVACPIALAAAVLASAATPSDPFPRATPEEVGVSKAALDELTSRIRTWIDQEDAVGAEILVVKKRRTVLHEAYGLADLDDRTPLRAGTIACIRSMTKPLVGTAIQILIDEGRLALDDAAAKYVPSFANDKSSGVTVRQLLTHTAGFPVTIINRPLSAYRSQAEVTDQAGGSGPTLRPGAFNYSDTDTFARMRREKQGGEAIDRLTWLELTGTVTIGAVSGTVSTSTSPSGDLRVQVRIGGNDELTEISAGRAHRRGSVTGDVELTGVFLEQVRVGTFFSRLDDWRRPFTDVAVVGRDKIEAVDVWVVRLRPKEMPPITRYVAIDTGLVVREDTWITVRGVGTVPMTVTCGDYRPVSGVMVPFRVGSTSALTGKQVTEYKEMRTK